MTIGAPRVRNPRVSPVIQNVESPADSRKSTDGGGGDAAGVERSPHAASEQATMPTKQRSGRRGPRMQANIVAEPRVTFRATTHFSHYMRRSSFLFAITLAACTAASEHADQPK